MRRKNNRRGTTYAEQVGSEGPSGLETQVDVGGIDEGTAAETDEEGTKGQDVLALFWEIVEGLERVEGEIIVMLDVERLDALHFEILLVDITRGVVHGMEWCLESVFLLGQRWAG